MRTDNYEYQTEFVREWVARIQKVREEGFQQGFEEGFQQGFQEGMRAALFEVLDARGLEVDEASRQQILACKELAQIKIWLRRAVTAKSVQELFESRPASPQSR